MSKRKMQTTTHDTFSPTTSRENAATGLRGATIGNAVMQERLRQSQAPQNGADKAELVEPDIIGKIDAIAENSDAGARNYDITDMYHTLSLQLDDAINPSPDRKRKNANWSTFATWASREAGQAIRGETGVADSALNALRSGSNRYDEAFGPGQDRVQAAVGAGNLDVFREIAPIMAMFSSTFAADAAPDPAKMEQFQAWLSERSALAEGSTNLLGPAFQSYYESKFEPNEDKRAELMLKGNALIGLHEQSRLQKHLDGALPGGSHVATPLGDLPVQRAATQHMLELEIPESSATTPAAGPASRRPRGTTRMPLGQPVTPPPRVNGAVFAPGLETLEDPALQSIVGRVDPDGDQLTSSGAENWNNFDDRMDYIVNLFRTHQDNADLFEAPYADR